MLKVQEYLRSGKTLQNLYDEYKIENRIKNNKVSLSYNMIESPMEEKIVQECRGLILRENTWDIVAFPFCKFFNYGEKCAAKIDWSSAKVLEKLDGSMIITYYDYQLNKWCFGTRSMPEADGFVHGLSITFHDLILECFKSMGINFYELAKERMAKTCTYIFEMTTPYNRIVVDYKDLKLTLLTIKDNREDYNYKEYNVNFIASKLKIPTPQEYELKTLENIITVINQWKANEHEGVVVVDKDFNRVKLKSVNYIAAHGTISSLSGSDRNVMRLIIKEQIDDLQPIMGDLLKKRIDEYKNKYIVLLERLRADYDSIKDIEDMKTFAFAANDKLYPAICFALKRGKSKSINDFMLKQTESDSSMDKIINLCGKIL